MSSQRSIQEGDELVGLTKEEFNEFNCNPCIHWDEDMSEHAGKKGVVSYVSRGGGEIHVRFSDGVVLIYPCSAYR